MSDDYELRDMPGGATREEIIRLLELIKRGVTPLSACSVTGISFATYKGWKKKGRDILQAIEDGVEPPLVDKPLHQESYVQLYIEARKAEGMFDARLDLELAGRVDRMETRELLRLRELRANSWNTDKKLKLEHSNDSENPMPPSGNVVNIGTVISFKPETLAMADQALLEAGIMDAEAVEVEE